MSHDSETAAHNDAVRDAKITGSYYRNGGAHWAAEEFGDWFHNTYDRDERRILGYHGILAIAQEWWEENKHRYG